MFFWDTNPFYNTSQETLEDRESCRARSSFHVLLKQLGEEHDRELSQAKETVGLAKTAQAASQYGSEGARDRPGRPSRVSLKAAKEDSTRSASSPQGGLVQEQRRLQNTPSTGSVKSVDQDQGRPKGLQWGGRSTIEIPRQESGEEDAVAVRVSVGKREVTGMMSTRNSDGASSMAARSSLNTPSSPKSFPTNTPEELVHMHPEWLVEPEDMKVAKSFSFANTTAPAGMKTQGSFGTSTLNPIHQEWKVKPSSVVRDPSSGLQLFWDGCGFLCIVFDIIWIPIYICFDAVLPPDVVIMEWMVRLFWTCDIFANCSLAYQKTDGLLERRLRCVAWHYITSRRFIFDVIILAADWIPAVLVGKVDLDKDSESVEVLGLLRGAKIPRALRVLRILRLARVVRIEHIVMAMKDSLLVSSETLSISLNMLKNMVCILLLVHVTACLWYFIGTGDSPEHWVHFYGLDQPDVSLNVKYLWAFYWVAGQWTPASAEVQPQNNTERRFNVVIIIGGVMTFSTFMGAITASITSLRNLGVRDVAQFFLLRRYLYENSISRSLSVRICRYTDLALEMHKRRIDHNKVQYLKLLSGPLKVELQKEIYLPHLRAHDFFEEYNHWDAAAMSHLCFVALSRAAIAKGDIVFSMGGECQKMYCAVNGTFVYHRRRGLRLEKDMSRPKRHARVGPRIWCCEASLWVRWYHFGSMAAMIESEVIEVDARKFREVTKTCDRAFSRCCAYAKDYAQALADNSSYAWDIPAALLYPQADGDSLSHFFWWQREVVDAETKEVGWMSDILADSDSDPELQAGETETLKWTSSGNSRFVSEHGQEASHVEL